MEKISSKDYPVIQRHRGRIAVPYDIELKKATTDDKQDSYEFSYLYLEDEEYDLKSPDVVAALAKKAESQVARKEYDTLLEKGYDVKALGFRIDCDTESCAKLTHSLVALQINQAKIDAEVIVRDYNNVNRRITYASFQALYKELFTYVEDVRHTKWGAKDE